MGFEEWMAWENKRAAENRAKEVAVELLEVCKEARNELIRFCHTFGTATPSPIRALKERLEAVITKATGESNV
jgi:hypothetical protein